MRNWLGGGASLRAGVLAAAGWGDSGDAWFILPSPPLPERGEPWGLSNSFRCPGLNLSVDVSQGPESRKSFTVLDLNGVLTIRGSLTGFGGWGW